MCRIWWKCFECKSFVMLWLENTLFGYICSKLVCFQCKLVPILIQNMLFFMVGLICPALCRKYLLLLNFLQKMKFLFLRQNLVSTLTQICGAWWWCSFTLLCTENFVVILKNVCLRWNLVSRIIQRCWIWLWYSVHGNCCVCFVKLFQKSGFWSLICGFPWKRESALIRREGALIVLWVLS